MLVYGGEQGLMVEFSFLYFSLHEVGGEGRQEVSCSDLLGDRSRLPAHGNDHSTAAAGGEGVKGGGGYQLPLQSAVELWLSSIMRPLRIYLDTDQ